MIALKKISLRGVCICAMLLLATASSYAKKPKPNYNFTHHEELTSGYENRDDDSFFPKYFFVEQNLDSLDFYVRVLPHTMKDGNVVGVSFWVDGENHADVILQNRWLAYVFRIQGKEIPKGTIYKGFPCKKETIVHIKRIDNDIVFYDLDEDEAYRIGLRYLYGGEYPTDSKARIALYAAHLNRNKPFTVEFDY